MTALTPLVTVHQQSKALVFTDYLNSIGIRATTVDATIDNAPNWQYDKGYVVLCDELQVSRAQQEFERFANEPMHHRYQKAAWQHGQTGDYDREHPSLFQQASDNFMAHAGLLTLIIFAACWLVYLGSYFGWAQSLFYALQFYPQISIEAVLAEPWRILGPALFHFSWLHIIFNTMWWWYLGGQIEERMGTKALLVIFVVSAIISNLGQFLVSGPNFGGLSGVVYALVGYIWWLGWLAPHKGLSLPQPLIGFMLFWILLGIANVLPVNMANTAHLLGLASGCFLAWRRSLSNR